MNLNIDNYCGMGSKAILFPCEERIVGVSVADFAAHRLDLFYRTKM